MNPKRCFSWYKGLYISKSINNQRESTEWMSTECSRDREEQDNNGSNKKHNMKVCSGRKYAKCLRCGAKPNHSVKFSSAKRPIGENMVCKDTMQLIVERQQCQRDESR